MGELVGMMVLDGNGRNSSILSTTETNAQIVSIPESLSQSFGALRALSRPAKHHFANACHVLPAAHGDIGEEDEKQGYDQVRPQFHIVAGFGAAEVDVSS